MTMTDPIADMFARIRNANHGMKDTVELPASREKLDIARILQAEGYVNEIEEISGAGGHPAIRIHLKYGDDRTRVILGLRRISKPGRRVYTPANRLPRVLGGMGVAILSTSSGLMTDKQARQRRVGGEVIGYVW